MKWLIFGHQGWIGLQIIENIQKRDPESDIIRSQVRADNEYDVEQELCQVNPNRVISVIGRTHGPGFSTIDYLEQEGKLVENIRDNLYGPLVLAICCLRFGFHLTYIGTGCIFNYDATHTVDNQTGYLDSDEPNFFGSSYSVVKGFTDKLMHILSDSVLNVRIRMPITSQDHPRNFISKIIRYKNICSIPNSMTVLDELLPIMIDMSYFGKKGTVNLTNPGQISHNEILDLYREIVDPNFTYQNFTIEEQSKILKSARSNNLLDTSRLEREYPQVKPIHEAIIETLRQWH